MGYGKGSTLIQNSSQ
jgi:hypothetical protein